MTNTQRGVSRIEFTTIIALLIVVATTAFIFGTTRKNKNTENTPTPTLVYNTPQPSVTPAATSLITATPSTPSTGSGQASSGPVSTSSPQAPPTASSTPTLLISPLVSGIKGIATLKSCANSSCTTTPIAQMKIDIKIQSGNFVTNVYTDTQGKFNVNLKPGEYVVGPFRDPTTSVVINAAVVNVTRGYFSEVNPKFESRQ